MNRQKSENADSKADHLTKSDKGSDKGGCSALTDGAYSVLRYMEENPEKNISIRALMDAEDLSRYYAKKYIDELLSGGFLERIGSKSGTTYEITEAGKLTLENTPTSYLTKSDKRSNTKVSDSREINGRVDNISYRIEFSDRCMIPEYGRETVLNELGDGWMYDESNGQYYVDKKRFHVRLTGERAIVYLRKEYRGLDVTALKSDSVDDILEIKEYLENDCKLDFKDHAVLMCEMNTQDIAIENHPIVQLVRDYTDLDLHSVSPAIDSKGRVRLFLDHSGTGDLEGANVGYPSGYGGFNEDDIVDQMEKLAHQCEYKEGWRGIRRLAELIEEKSLMDVLDSESEGSFEVSCDGSVELSKQVDVSKGRSVDLCEVSSVGIESSSGDMCASDNKDIEKAESLKDSTMSVSENSNKLDVRNLPGTTIEDSKGNRMTVAYVNNVEGGFGGNKEPVAVLEDGSRKVEIGLEELKADIISSGLEVV